MTTKLGRIIHGDCIKELAKIDAGSVDLVFADPPFNIGYQYDEYDDKRTGEDYLAWSRRWIERVKRVLKPDGTFWLAIGDEYAADLKVMATRKLGLTCRNWVVWYYTFGVHCVNKFTRSHAHLFYFVKDPKKFTFNTDDIRVPSARQLVYGDKRANPKGRVPDDTWIIRPNVETSKRRKVEKSKSQGAEASNQPYRDRKGAGNVPHSDRETIHSPKSAIHNRWVLRPQDLPGGFSADSDTWYFPRVCGTFKERGGFHGCQMPEQLLGRIIKACSNEGDLILDPFSGSGTTLVVAKKLNRRYLGIELSEQYVAETKARLARTEPGDPLDGAKDPLTSVATTANGTIRTADGRRTKHEATSLPHVPPDRARVDETARGVIEAFRSAHGGFSGDWVLAEKELNAEFVGTCRRLSLPGDPASWNATLLRLRKAKKLGVYCSRPSPRLDRQRIHECEFASEIALSKLHDTLDMTLDRVLCDPLMAGKFDALAEMIAPGFPSVYYRWAAFGLRKKAADARKYAEQYAAESTSVPLVHVESVGSLSLRDIPERPGVYLLLRPDSSPRERTVLYVGKTKSLRNWLQDREAWGTFDAVPFRDAGSKQILYAYARRRVDEDRPRLGLQAHLTERHRPIWNFRALGVTAA